MIDMTMALEIGKEVCGPFEYVYSSFLIVVCVRNVGLCVLDLLLSVQRLGGL